MKSISDYHNPSLSALVFEKNARKDKWISAPQERRMGSPLSGGELKRPKEAFLNPIVFWTPFIIRLKLHYNHFWTSSEQTLSEITEIWEHINRGFLIFASYFPPQLAQVDFPLKWQRLEKWEILKESVGHDTRFWNLIFGNNRFSAEILLIIVNSWWKSNLQRKSAIFWKKMLKFANFGIFNVFS